MVLLAVRMESWLAAAAAQPTIIIVVVLVAMARRVLSLEQKPFILEAVAVRRIILGHQQAVA
jgi:hypothetical protein